MPTEIKRKFLVRRELLDLLVCLKPERIVQAYWSLESGIVARVRVRDKRLFLTLRGPLNESGLSWKEYEIGFPLAAARAIFKEVLPGRVTKKRYVIPLGEHNWDLDVFSGQNKGLLLVGLKLPSEDADFSKPSWFGPEVTTISRYSNLNLIRYPYSLWTDEEKRGK